MLQFTSCSNIIDGGIGLSSSRVGKYAKPGAKWSAHKISERFKALRVEVLPGRASTAKAKSSPVIAPVIVKYKTVTTGSSTTGDTMGDFGKKYMKWKIRVNTPQITPETNPTFTPLLHPPNWKSRKTDNQEKYGRSTLKFFHAVSNFIRKDRMLARANHNPAVRRIMHPEHLNVLSIVLKRRLPSLLAILTTSPKSLEGFIGISNALRMTVQHPPHPHVVRVWMLLSP